jgi:hypothetical protein
LGIDQVDGATYARIALRMAQLRKYTSIQEDSQNLTCRGEL